jgi:hypothetical protein
MFLRIVSASEFQIELSFPEIESATAKGAFIKIFTMLLVPFTGSTFLNSSGILGQMVGNSFNTLAPRLALN